MFFNAIKDPDAILDYGIDWTAWLQGDVITESTWTVPPGNGLVAVSSSINSAGTQTVVWLTGGVLEAVVPVANHITTLSGRQDDRTILVQVRSK